VDGNVRAMPPRVVVSGIGVVSTFGASREAFRDGLLAGHTGIAPVTAFDVSACRSRLAASVTGFDAAAWIAPMKLRRMDDAARYAVVVTRQAFEDAAYPLSADGDDHAGVIMGTFTAGGQATSEYLTALHGGGAAAAPAILFNSTVANAAASLAGLEFKLRGPNVTMSQKESAGLAAIVSATDTIRLGRAPAVAAGGVDAIFDIFFRVHSQFGVMAAGDNVPPGPFDRSRRGFVLGEGGFALLLEDAAAGAARGARIYGTILGVGAGSAAVGINQWPDAPAAIARTMTAAIDDAGLTPADINAVYASANATTVLDRVEAQAIARIFGAHRPLVTSIKGAIGECGASGAASCVAALLCGAQNGVPPIAGLRDVDSEIADLPLVRERQAMSGRTVLVNSIASGGALFSVVLSVASR
jgi:3-oxoacyl-[acyl-carrier-protein] synthase II